MANVSILTRTKNPWANIEFDDITFVKLEIKNKRFDLFGSCSKERYGQALSIFDQTINELKPQETSHLDIVKKVAERWDIVFNNSQKNVEQSIQTSYNI